MSATNEFSYLFEGKDPEAILQMDPFMPPEGVSWTAEEMQAIYERKNEIIERTRSVMMPEVQNAPEGDILYPGLPGWSVPASGENIQFPGGPKALSEKFSHLLEKNVRHMEELYGSPRSGKIQLFWSGKEELGAHVERDISVRQPQDMPEFFCNVNATLNVGKTTVEKTLRHELSHLRIDPWLPSMESLWEAMAGYIEYKLREAGEDDVSWSGGGYRMAFQKPVIVQGAPGWGTPEFAQTACCGAINSAAVNSAQCALLLDVCGNDFSVLEKIIQRSKETSDKKPLVMLEKLSAQWLQLPSLEEWLLDMDGAVRGFRQKFLASELNSPFPEGDRLVWYPHGIWGGILSAQRFIRNPAFHSFDGQNLDVDFGTMGDAQVFDISLSFSDIPGKSGDFQLRGDLDLDPSMLVSAYAGMKSANIGSAFDAANEREKMFGGLPYGTRISLSLLGKEPFLELTWDEKAESICKDPKKW